MTIEWRGMRQMATRVGRRPGSGEGTVLIPWQQVRLDGMSDALPEDLVTGAGFEWTGARLHLVPGAPLRLDDAIGMEALRARAARRVPLRQALGIAPRDETVEPAPLRRGFEVCNGPGRWFGTLVTTAQGTLVAFEDGAPPPRTECWVGAVTGPAERPVDDGLPCTKTVGIGSAAWIEAAHGLTPAGQIAAGHRLRTPTGIAAVLSVRRRTLSAARLIAMPDLRPLVLAAGAMASAPAPLPPREMLLMPGQGVAMSGKRTERLWAGTHVTVAAADLPPDAGARPLAAGRGAEVVSITLDRPDLIRADGLWIESAPDDGTLYPGRLPSGDAALLTTC